MTGCSTKASRDTLPAGNNLYQMVTGDDSDEDRGHWDNLFNTHIYVYGTEPAKFIKDHIESLPRGRTLDIAMGEGRNAIYMAKKGFSVEGVDYSQNAIRKAQLLAKENHVTISAINADLNHYNIHESTYSVILNINYLQRSLVPQIKRGLKRGGVVVFENQTTDQLKLPKSQSIPRDFLLHPGELREMFKDYRIVLYRETNDGKNAMASLIAQKP